MNDFAAKKGETGASHFDIVRRIETMSGEIPYAIKQFRSQVLDFCSMDKKLLAIKSKTEKRASSKKLDKLESFVIEYQSAYRKCYQSYTSITKALDEIDSLYSKLSDYYNYEGKRKEAKRAISDGEKFDKLSRKQLLQIYNKLDSCEEIALAKETIEGDGFEEREEKLKTDAPRKDARGDEARRRGDEGAHRYGPNPYGAPYPPYPPYYPGYDYRMPPAYYQPMPSFNIAPISIDVNSAVDSLFDSFTKAFDERVREYAENYEFPEVKRSATSGVESEALDKAIEDESFALEKFSALFEKIDAMLSSLSALTAKYSELEDKTRTLTESMKNATDTQRTLARELQGIQATQKVIGGDQLKLAEEQTIIVEAQAVALSRQAELRDAENAVSNEIASLLDGANANVEAFKASLDKQSDVANSLETAMTAADKLLELQKNLEERQSELTEIQREALLAQKKLTRSQKALNERLGAKTSAKKERNELEKITPPEAAKPEILDSTLDSPEESTEAIGAESTERETAEAIAEHTVEAAPV